MKRLPYLLLLLLIVASGCRKEEDALEAELIEEIDLNDLYGNRFAALSIGSDYQYQAYFSLADNQLVGSYDKFSWDIAITNEAPARVVLNSSIINLRVAKSDEAWDIPLNAAGHSYTYDRPERYDDYLAIGEDYEGVWILDRGVTGAGVARGHKKFMVAVDDDSYTVTVANLDGSDEVSYQASVDPQYNHTSFSFDNGVVNVEPPKTTWDLLFTSYLFVFDPDGSPNPYQVTGTLINPHQTRAHLLDDTDYTTFTPGPEHTSALSSAADAIGYDWKIFDFDLGFIVVPNRVYYIQTQHDRAYALQFTAFLDANGVRGNPEFTFRLLP